MLTPEKHAEIIEYLHADQSLSESARLARIGVRTLRVWRQRGEIEDERVTAGERPKASEERYRRFFLETERALIERKAYARGVITSTMQQTEDLRLRFQAATWYLERLYPGEYARTTRVTVDHVPDETIDTHDLTAITEAAREEVLGLIDEVAERRKRRKASGE